VNVSSSTGITSENEEVSTIGRNMILAAKPSAVVDRKLLDGFGCTSLAASALHACKGREDVAVMQSGKTAKGGEEDVATLLTLALTIIATI